MKLGVFSLMQWPDDRSQGSVHANELEQLSAVEPMGYDSVWLAGHPFSGDGTLPSIHLGAAHLAARTSRIRIGTAVTALPFFHPLRLAEEVAMLDILSGGRFDWGIGRGSPGRELADLEVDVEQSQSIFREQLEIILEAWTGAAFGYEGEHYRFPRLQCLPTPVQDPHPPIFIVAPSPSTVEWAAGAGWPVLSDPFSPTAQLAESRAAYRGAAAAAGVDMSELSLPVLRHTFVGASMKQARELAGPALLRSYRARARTGWPAATVGDDDVADPDRVLDLLFEHCSIVGDEAYCTDKLSELHEALGLDTLLAWQDFGDLPPEATLASQRRLVEKVAPTLP